MVIDLSRFSSILGILYKDSFSASGTEKVEYDDGSSNNVYGAISTDRPCSFHAENTLVIHEVEGKPILNLSPLLISSPSENLKTGDSVVVLVKTASGTVVDTVTGIVGKINHFQTHLEADVDIEVKP